jgi:hypothetical protein
MEAKQSNKQYAERVNPIRERTLPSDVPGARESRRMLPRIAISAMSRPRVIMHFLVLIQNDHRTFACSLILPGVNTSKAPRHLLASRRKLFSVSVAVINGIFIERTCFSPEICGDDLGRRGYSFEEFGLSRLNGTTFGARPASYPSSIRASTSSIKRVVTSELVCSQSSLTCPLQYKHRFPYSLTGIGPVLPRKTPAADKRLKPSAIGARPHWTSEKLNWNMKK